jgi:hypothetical protein
MRSVAILSFVISVLFAACQAAAAPPSSDGSSYHIALSRSTVSAGEQVEMKLVPPVPPGVRVNWPVATGTTHLIYSAAYRAPYVIAAGSPPVNVSVGISGPGVKTIVSVEIVLLPSSVPGTEGCLGPDQSFSTTAGTIVPDFTFADELPQLVHSVAPDYPRSDLARRIEDTIPVVALLCRTGHVLDAYIPPSYANPGDLQPIHHDPKMVEAAIAAVRQYVFTPAMKSGQAIATWITIPVAFRQ